MRVAPNLSTASPAKAGVQYGPQGLFGLRLQVLRALVFEQGWIPAFAGNADFKKSASISGVILGLVPRILVA